MNPTPVDPIAECVRLSQEVELYKTLWKQRDGELMETLNDAVKIEEERNQLKRENTDLTNAVSELRSEEVIARMQIDQLREDVTLLRSELARYQQMRPRTALELSEANDKLNEELAELKRDRDGWKKADVLARIRIGELERERDEAQRDLRIAHVALDERDQLRANLAAAREDTARLEHVFEACRKQPDSFFKWPDRTAIDAARAGGSTE